MCALKARGFDLGFALSFSIDMPGMDTSYLTTQVTTIIGQLHGLFDDIGVPKHERESRETEVCRCDLRFS